MRVKAWGMKKPKPWLIAGLIFSVGLVSCSVVGRSLPKFGGQPTPFKPPSLVANATPFIQVTPTPQPTPEVIILPTPQCSNILTFLEDLTIPDGTQVQPGDALDKRWLVQNNGTCNWNERYRLKLIAGSALGLPEEQALYPARSGTQAIIRLLFTAPDQPGLQRSAWQAFSPQGEAFGDPIYIEVFVESSAP